METPKANQEQTPAAPQGQDTQAARPNPPRLVSEARMMVAVLIAVILSSGVLAWLLLSDSGETVRISGSGTPAANGANAAVPAEPSAWSQDPATPTAAEAAEFHQTLARGPKPTIAPTATPPAPAPGAAKRDPALVFPQASGAFEWDGFVFRVVHFDDQWQISDQQTNLQVERGYPRRPGGVWELLGRFNTLGGAFAYQQRFKRLDPQTMIYEAMVSSDSGVSGQRLALDVDLPASSYEGQQLVLDGRPVVLKAGMAALPQQPAQMLQIATTSGQIVIKGALRVTIQDNRSFGGQGYSVRLAFNPGEGLIKQASLKLFLHHLSENLGTASAPAAEAAATPTPAAAANPK